MINKTFVAIALCIGFLLSTGCVVSQMEVLTNPLLLEGQPLQNESTREATIEDKLSGWIFLGEPGDESKGLDLERMADVLESLKQYHFRIEYNPGIFYEGDVDLLERQQHILVGLTSGVDPIAEVFLKDEHGIGHKIDSDIWLPVRLSPLPNDPNLILELLRHSEIISSEETPSEWIVTLQPPNTPIMANLGSSVAEAVQTTSCCDPEMAEKVLEISQKIEYDLHVVISKEDLMIREYSMTLRAPEIHFTMKASFSPASGQETISSSAIEASHNIDQELPLEMLLLEIPTLGGWYDSKSHSPWAQRSIKMIQDTDTAGEYREIYDSYWSEANFTEQVARAGGQLIVNNTTQYHPIVLGAYYEDESGPLPQLFHSWFQSDANYQSNKDYYWDTNGYFRDYHHYGFKDIGLEYRWFYIFRGTPPSTTMPEDRYYSCREWGYGDGRINEDLNRMTWTQAIRQYNRYTLEGKRNAYLMLGFVTHLLQDQGHPDHAFNEPHPGSGMDEKEAYERYKFCHLVAAEAAVAAVAACATTGPFAGVCSLVAAPIAYGIAYGACEASIDPNEMGYEKLIAEKWDISRVEKQIMTKGVVNGSDYNSFFDNLGKFAMDETSKMGLKSVLGCGMLVIPPVGVPGADPDIQSNDPSAVKPYFDLTDKLVPEIVGSSAGLTEHFYEIVNYPPIAQRVAIVQWESGDTPRGFAFFAQDKNQCLRYNASWTTSGGKRILTQNVPAKNQQLSLDRSAYVFVLFGPSDIGPVTGGKNVVDPMVRLTGTNSLDGQPIDIVVSLQTDQDSELGTYYWGSFDPHNCGDDPYDLTLEISAKDTSAHLDSRNPMGVGIDSDPSTLAYANPDGYPTYPLIDYETGADKNHEIKVSTFKWNLDVQPQNITLAPGRSSKGEVILKVQQKSYDCQWEPFWSTPSCNVEWELKENAIKLGGSLKMGSFKKSGINAYLEKRVNGEAKLIVQPNWDRYVPGIYEIEVDYRVGEAPKIKNGTVKVGLELV